MTQAQTTNPYAPIRGERECNNPAELETQTPTLRSRLVEFFQATMWCLAGGTLIGFAVSVLWWEPICQGPASPSNSKLQPHNTSTYSTVYTWTKKLNKEEECNPFYQKGYLHYNASNPGDNIWKPFRPDCQPSKLFEKLKENLYSKQESFDEKEDDPFEWLRNRTVILIGDSIDRQHNVDFCKVLSWEPGSTEKNPIISENPPTRTYYIDSDSKLSPPLSHFYPEDATKPPEGWPKSESDFSQNLTSVWDADLNNTDIVRPMVCRIPKFGFTIISLFTWGLDPKETGSLYSKISASFPPAEYTSRISNILQPILENLSKELNNSMILRPDLIEMSSGYWDLREWSEEDKKIAKEEKVPEELMEEIGLDDLDVGRLNWWTERQKKAITFVADFFPQSQTPILWRSLHHVQDHYWFAFSRVNQLDQLARYNIDTLKEQDPILASRLRVDEWGALMLGQEHRFRDAMHVKELPGEVLWGDIMLWELRRAIQKRGFSYYTS